MIGWLLGLGFQRLHLALAGGIMGMLVIVTLLATAHGRGVADERNRMDPWAERVCEAAGSAFQEKHPKTGKPLKRAKWGRQCVADVVGLAKFKTDALAATASVLTEHVTVQEKKAGVDHVVARRNTERTRVARQKMEAVDAAVPDTNRVDGSWFDTLNVLGGLPDPEAATGPDGAGPAAEGNPAG